MRIVVVACLLFLTACTVDIPKYQLDRAEKQCENKGGVGLIGTNRFFWMEDIKALCADNTRIYLNPFEG